jgi:lauroyl/myristoyl acyltransferase
MDTDSISKEHLAQGLDAVFGALPPAALVKVAQHVAMQASAPARVMIHERPLSEVVKDLFGPRLPVHEGIVAAQVVLNEYRNICVDKLRDLEGFRAIAELVQHREVPLLHEFHAARRPAILVLAHLGARFAGAAALQRLGVPAAIFMRAFGPQASREAEAFAARLPGMEYLQVAGSAESGALQLRRAIQRLRAGGMVAIAADADVTAQRRIPVRYLGRQIHVGRGPALMARISGAPVVPIVAAFLPTGLGISLQVGDPLPPPVVSPLADAALEQAVAQSILSWFESFVRGSPGQMRVRQLNMLAQAPRAAAIQGMG